MSDHILRLIPTDPRFIPAEPAEQAAARLLDAFLPGADDITSDTDAAVQFVDAGNNLEEIRCPGCGRVLPWDWWQQAMEAAEANHFADLQVATPCCGEQTTLNDLRYHWPAGFARYVLEALNPGADLDEDQLTQLEQALGCSLRKIWAHV